MTRVNGPARLGTVALLLAAITPLSVGQARRSTYDPANQNQPAKPRQGFIDFTLGRINSSDKDYGQCISESRKLVLDETLENTYFWSNLTALGLLGCLFIIIVYQHRAQVRREWTAAEMLAQYAHALSRANAQADEATRKNHDFMEAFAALKEAGLRGRALPAEMVEPVPPPTRRNRSSAQSAPATTATTSPGKTAVERPSSTAAAVAPINQMGLFKPDVDLVIKVNSLEQQLARSREESQQLRRQLNDSDRRLQVEQQKNRTLKGE